MLFFASMLSINDEDESQGVALEQDVHEIVVEGNPDNSYKVEDVARTDCIIDSFRSIQISDREAKRDEIIDYLKSLYFQEDNRSDIDEIAFISEVNIINMRRALFGTGANTRNLLNAYSISQERLKQQYSVESVSDIVALISSEQLPIDTYVYISGQGFVSLLSFIIEQEYFDMEAGVLSLLGLGLEVSLPDLLVATRKHVALPMIEVLVANSAHHIDKVVYQNGRFLSNLLVATNIGSAEQAHYWIEKGSPSYTDNFGPSAIDIVVKRKALFSKDEYLSLLSKLIRINGNFNSQVSARELSQLHKASLIPGGFTFKGGELDHVDSKIYSQVDKLNEIVMKGFDLPLSVSKVCSKKYASSYINHLITLPRKQSKGALVSTSDKVRNDIVLDTINRFDENQFQIEQHLSQYGGLEGKKLIESYRLNLLSEAAEQVKLTLKEANSDIKETSLHKALTFAVNDEWDSAISILYNIARALSKPQIDSFVTIAVTNTTDMLVYDALFKLGASIPPHAIEVIIVNDNVQLAKQLVPHGLQFEYQDHRGYSALMLSVEHESIGMFNLLIDSGLNVNNLGVGFDSLDIALMRLEKLTTSGISLGDFPYISRLINSDAIIAQSHLDIMDSIWKKNINLYTALISVYPSLSSNIVNFGKSIQKGA